MGTCFQELSGSAVAENGCCFSVAEDVLAADEHCGDGLVVAIDHAGEVVVLHNRAFRISVERIVEMSGIDHNQVGAIT